MTDDTEPTKERLRKAATYDDAGKVIDTGFEDFITDDSKLTKRMLDGSVLDALFSKAERYPIDGDQYAAGCQFHKDWDDSGSGKIGAVDTTRDAVDGGQMKDMTAKAIDALGRYRRASKAVGHTHAHVLFHVVLFEERLELYGQKWCCHRSKKLAKVAAKEALRRALTDLAFHYFGKRQGRTVAAHEPDYRPSIMGATG